MLLADFIRESTIALEELYPGPEAGNIVSLVCQERFGTRTFTHIVNPGFEIDGRLAEEDIRRLLNWEPVQYVLGKAFFCGREFKVGPGILIPRPETETLVELAERFLKGKEKTSVLDLCTGSGCIAWTIKKDIPDAEVTAVDISDKALETASKQFEGPSPSFLKADILDKPRFDRKFDLITCNPPYICETEKKLMRRNVLDFEPSEALFVPDDDPLVFYRAAARWAEDLLKEDGCGMVEINENYGEETVSLFRKEGFPHTRPEKDIFGKPRFVIFSKKAI